MVPDWRVIQDGNNWSIQYGPFPNLDEEDDGPPQEDIPDTCDMCEAEIGKMQDAVENSDGLFCDDDCYEAWVAEQDANEAEDIDDNPMCVYDVIGS